MPTSSSSSQPEAHDVALLLEHLKLQHLTAALSSECLGSWSQALAENRTHFLAHLRDIGVSNLSERQRIANALKRWTAQRRLHPLSTAMRDGRQPLIVCSTYGKLSLCYRKSKIP